MFVCKFDSSNLFVCLDDGTIRKRLLSAIVEMLLLLNRSINQSIISMFYAYVASSPKSLHVGSLRGRPILSTYLFAIVEPSHGQYLMQNHPGIVESTVVADLSFQQHSAHPVRLASTVQKFLL
jgi:hypothetical protein